MWPRGTGHTSVDTLFPPSTHSHGPAMKEIKQDVILPVRRRYALIVDCPNNDYVTTLRNCVPPVKDFWSYAIDVDNTAVCLIEYTPLNKYCKSNSKYLKSDFKSELSNFILTYLHNMIVYVLSVTVSPCINMFYRTLFPLIAYNDGSVTDVVCLCVQEILGHNTTWTTGNWTSKQWSDWRKNFTCLYLHLLFIHNTVVTSSYVLWWCNC